jgi:two-component system, chemotaxis family, response regulator Rcp1
MAAKPFILMVEDNPLDVTLLREAMRDSALDGEVGAVATCFEAVTLLERAGKHARARRPDAILIDLNLPMDDGTQLLAFLSRSDRHRAIPAAVYSSAPATGLAADTVYLVKPATFAGFAPVLEWLREALRLAAAAN